MRQRIALRSGWTAILFAFAWLIAACTQGGMNLHQAAYSPTESMYMQAGEPTPGEDGQEEHKSAASHGGMTPAQVMYSMQEEEAVQTLPALDEGLPSQRSAVLHAVRSIMFIRPLSELASRTGGHAPPRI